MFCSRWSLGDLVLADKGFLIHDLMPAGVSLIIPPFLDGPHFTKAQVEQTTHIARACIHVEHAIQRLKSFDILDHIRVSLRPFATIVFQVCGALSNLQRPIIGEISRTLNYQDLQAPSAADVAVDNVQTE
jgi:hypothetical protein